MTDCASPRTDAGRTHRARKATTLAAAALPPPATTTVLATRGPRTPHKTAIHFAAPSSTHPDGGNR